MKRRIIAVLLALLIVAPLSVSVSADNSGLIFTATNDTLLDLGSMAAFSGGILYVPIRVFSAYGVYNNYFEPTTTAMLYNSTKQIFFELNTGNSYDAYNNPYSVSAIFKNGQVYVPVEWVCTYFGLSYSYIKGTGYGDIVRIRNGLEVLSDSQFLDAANSLMRTRYNEYYGTSTPVTPTPTVDIKPEESPDEVSVQLCFIGLPSDKALDSLDVYSSIKACYFVTAEEAIGSPDVIRRISGSGHSIGIYCKSSPEKEISATSDAIFEAAQLRPTLITSPTVISKACTEYASANGYAYYTQKVTFSDKTRSTTEIISKIDNAKSYVSLSFFSGDNMDKNLPSVLQIIAAKQISVLPLLETYV